MKAFSDLHFFSIMVLESLQCRPHLVFTFNYTILNDSTYVTYEVQIDYI